MNKYIWMILMCLPIISIAQESDQYLEGAIPLKNGKVHFTTELVVPAMSKDQIYETAIEWAEARFQMTDKFNARILYKDKEKGSIAIAGEEYIVFSSNSFSLDRTRIYYLLGMYCEDGKCRMEMNRIHYWYNEARDGGEKFTAEEWITDEMTLNKDKDKLYPITGKFRKKTIDLKNDLSKEMRSMLGNKMIALGLEAAPVVPESQVVVNVPEKEQRKAINQVTSQPTAVANETTVSSQSTPKVERIQETSRITLRVNGEELEISKECWGGQSQLFGKDVTYCIIDTQKTMANMLLVQNETYQIVFYTNGNNQATRTIKCKKMMQQNINGEEAKKMNAECDVNKSYNVYVGEIIE